jgi:hypothetical protein
MIRGRLSQLKLPVFQFIEAVQRFIQRMPWMPSG